MVYSLNIKPIKTAMLVAIALTTISCLVPIPAQAINLVSDSIKKPKIDVKKIKFKISGSPNNQQTNVDFTLDPSVTDSNLSPNAGIFAGAIQGATVTCQRINGSLGFGCTEEGTFVFSEPGDLIAVQPSPSENTILYTARLFDEAKTNFFDIEIKFPLSDDEFTVAESINSLEPLSQYLDERNGNSINTVKVGFNNLVDPGGATLSVTTVEVPAPPSVKTPEPNLTGSLLGTGAIGTVLLLKRVGRSRKSSDIQSSAIKIQERV